MIGVVSLAVQGLLGELRLALEAMLPGFNRYTGAEAIGARSDLYICRPSKGARVGDPPAAGRSRRAGRSDKGGGGIGSGARIYTRGAAAEEAPSPVLPEAVLSAARSAAGDGLAVLVGEGFIEPSVGLPEFFGRAAAWAIAARRGPFPFAGTLLINTFPDYGAAAFRTLLLAAPERAVLTVPPREKDRP